MKALLERLLGRSTSPESDFELLYNGNRFVPNVLIFTEHVNATYFISFDIPLRSLHSQKRINFAVVSQKHVESREDGCWERWAREFRPDVVILTRYGHASGPRILDYFKRCGTPVIYHIDDDLLEIPESLGVEIRQRHGADDVVATRSYLLKNCDLIYASTAPLASLMKERFPDQKVFHGIYAPYMGDMVASPKLTACKNPVIGYMGSKGHQLDLEMIVPALERLLEEQSDLEFEVFGTIKMPKSLERFGNRVRSRSVQKSYREFLTTLSGLNWDIGLAPLVDTSFNRCKAPTKFIEYTACAIPVVASNVPVYADVMPKKGGVIVDEDWYDTLSDFLSDPKARLDAINNARTFCKERYGLNVLENQLITLLKNILTIK